MIYQSYKRLWKHLDKPAKAIAFLAVSCTIFSSALEAVGVGGLVLVMHLVENPAQALTHPALLSLQETLQIESRTTLSIFICLCVALFYVLKNGILLFTSWLQAYFGARVRTLITSQLMDWYLRRPYIKHLRDKPAALVYLLASSSEDGVLHGIVPAMVLFTESLAIIAILSIAFSFYPVETLVFLTLLGVLPGGFYVLFLHRKTRRIGIEGLQARQTLHGSLSHSLASIKEIRTSGKEDYFFHKFRALMERASSLRALEMVFLKVMPPLVESFIAVALITAAIASLLYSNGMQSALPMLALFGAAGLRVLPSIFRMSQALQLLAVANAPLKELLDQMDNMRPAAPSRHLPKPPFQSLHLEDVSFTYPGNPAPTLKGISLTLKKGQVIGLVGPSGAGKTTLADLLLGILPPDSGRLRVNGAPVTDTTDLPIRLSYIPQDITLLDDTLRRNIAFGVPDAAIDESHVHDCARRASLDTVIGKLPHGLDTVLNERGVGLSGGQRQRVALARALYDCADLLVLDEATSALDATSEADVTAAIHGLRGTTTCVIIAHRLSTVQDCDCLYYIDNGRITASGSFQKLVSTVPQFRHMVHLSQVRTAKAPDTEAGPTADTHTNAPSGSPSAS